MNNNFHETLIVGAGLAGLKLATELPDHVILEKSRGVGGRIATRRIEGLGLDHGAPYLDGMIRKGGMNQIAKDLTPTLTIHKNKRAEKIKRLADSWQVETEDGEIYTCRNLVITAPVPQALSLLDQNNLGKNAGALRSIVYTKALIYLAEMDAIPSGATSKDNVFLMRERELHPQGVVMHLSEEDAESFFEKSVEVILAHMREVIKNSSLGSVKIDELKKWRYSFPKSTYPESFFEVEDRLYLTGDGFSGALHSVNNLVQVLRSLA